LDSGLDRSGIQGRKAIGQRWLDAKHEAREVARLGSEGILPEEDAETSRVRDGVGEARS